MNEELRARHWERITDERARRMYDELCDACDRRPGGMTDPDQMLVGDVAYAEQVKGMLMDDIAQRGIGKEVRNGRQTYWADNKSLTHYRAYCDQQRKHLAELKLTPNGRKAETADVPLDDFDKFPD